MDFMNSDASLTLKPVGHVRTGMVRKFDAPHQPNESADEINRVELLPGSNFELALQDLEGFDRIWLISWFDRNTSWRPRVLPPRGPAKRRGVFATRSPHRPNPVGLTCVRLISVAELVLEVGPLDLTDGTPILDIKPYVRTVDAFPESSLGWIEAVENASQADPLYRIEVSALAQAQLHWLQSRWGIDFTPRAFAQLARDPSPHRTRRILHLGNERYRMACGPWRLFFRIEKHLVHIDELGVGYSEESLLAPGFDEIVDRDAQLQFLYWRETLGG